jgi:hypothetical protein
LGYYDEAMKHFLECTSFYRSKLNENHHENEQFNYEKAYLNCLHQLTVLNRYLHHFKSDSLSMLGYRLTANNNDFVLEKAIFSNASEFPDFIIKIMLVLRITCKNLYPIF